MDPNYTNPTTPPVMPPTPEAPAEKTEEKSGGPIIAIVIIVIIVLIGGFYLWKSGAMKRTVPAIAPATTGTVSSDVASIEADLNAIDIGSDSGLNQLETQF